MNGFGGTATMAGVDMLYEMLQDLSYDSRKEGQSIQVAIPLNGKVFPAIVTIDDSEKNVVVSCQLCTLGQISETDLAAAAFSALSLNAEIHPFALALLNDNEVDIDKSDPIVLIDSKPLTGSSREFVVINFEKSDMENMMSSLLRALTTVVPKIRFV